MDLAIFEHLSCHRHFYYEDVMIIMLYVSSTNTVEHRSRIGACTNRGGIRLSGHSARDFFS